MKQHCFYLDERSVSAFFSPIRSKTDVINLLMKTIKTMLLGNTLTESKAAGKLVLFVSKMSRVFYFSGHKYFSVNFPFTVIENLDGSLTFSSKLVDNIDHKLTSEVIGLINSDEFLNSSCIYEFNDQIAKVEEANLGFWSIIKELLLCEDGYIRYDYDIKNSNGKLHPTNHLDVFYSPGPTFKIGINNRIPHGALMDLVDLKSDCHFLDTK